MNWDFLLFFFLFNIFFLLIEIFFIFFFFNFFTNLLFPLLLLFLDFLFFVFLNFLFYWRDLLLIFLFGDKPIEKDNRIYRILTLFECLTTFFINVSAEIKPKPFAKLMVTRIWKCLPDFFHGNLCFSISLSDWNYFFNCLHVVRTMFEKKGLEKLNQQNFWMYFNMFKRLTSSAFDPFKYSLFFCKFR